MTDIRNLAEHLGLSVGTVSRALNDRPEVSRETRNRVVEAARLIGYVPNQAGRSLRQGSTRMFGFVLGRDTLSFQKDGTLLFDVVSAIQRELARHKLDLVVFPGPGDEDVTRYVKRLAQRHIVDGLVIADTQEDPARIRYYCETALSLPTFGEEDGGQGRSYVEIDLGKIVRESVRRFSALGHVKIALALGSRYSTFSKAFLRYFEQEMNRCGLSVRQDYIFNCGDGAYSGYLLAKEIAEMRDRPTAIIAMEWGMILGFYDGLNEVDLRPGRDIAVMGPVASGDDNALQLKPSGFRIDLEGLGRTIAAKLLSGVAEYASSYEPQPLHLVWPLTLVEGESDSYRPSTLAAS